MVRILSVFNVQPKSVEKEGHALKSVRRRKVCLDGFYSRITDCVYTSTYWYCINGNAMAFTSRCDARRKRDEDGRSSLQSAR